MLRSKLYKYHIPDNPNLLCESTYYKCTLDLLKGNI